MVRRAPTRERHARHADRAQAWFFARRFRDASMPLLASW
jgi:hypothetical protein